MSDIKKLLIKDILSVPTQSRPEYSTINEPAEQSIINDAVSELPGIDPSLIRRPAPGAVVEENDDSEEEYEQSHEESAQALIDMIDIAQKTLFILWGSKKLKKKIPEELMEEFILIDIKDMRGEELTDDEKKKFERYKQFEHRLNKIASDVPFTDEEKEEMMNATKALVKKTGLKIPPGLWFGALLASNLSKRAIDIGMMS